MKKILLLLCSCYTVMSYAACPIAFAKDRGNLIKNVAQITSLNKLYFCQKTGFSTNNRTINLSPHNLSTTLSGATKSISLAPPPIASVPLGITNVSITGGGNPQALPLNGTPESDLPKPQGYGGSSIFNFYVHVPLWNDCLSWQTTIKNYLRNNASRFSAKTSSGAVQYASGINNGDNFAKITGTQFKNTNGKTIIGDLFFVHANPGNEQYFSNKPLGSRMCWFGVKTELKLDFSTTPPEESGTYNVNVRFN